MAVNVTNVKKETPVYLAAWKGHHKVVTYLVEDGNATAFVKELDNNNTAFHWIVQRKWLDLVKYLAESGQLLMNT